MEGTIVASPGFDRMLSAKNLENAVNHADEHSEKIIGAIARINNHQRLMLREPYHESTGKNVMDELKKKLSGDFCDTVIGLMEKPSRYDTLQLRKAMKGLGTNEAALIEILCFRSPNELQVISKEYMDEFGKSLEEDIASETSGDFKNLLLALLRTERDASNAANIRKSRELAKIMFSDKAKKGKPNKDTFVEVFSACNFRQIRRIFSEYMSMNGETIEEGIERAFSGDAKNAHIALATSVRNAPRFFAKQLHNAVKGLGTKDNDLQRIIITRSEVDLKQIRAEFENLYKVSLIDKIKAECSGSYRDLLAAIVRGNESD